MAIKNELASDSLLTKTKQSKTLSSRTSHRNMSRHVFISCKLLRMLKKELEERQQESLYSEMGSETSVVGSAPLKISFNRCKELLDVLHTDADKKSQLQNF